MPAASPVVVAFYLASGEDLYAGIARPVDFEIGAGKIKTFSVNTLSAIDPKNDPAANPSYPANPPWHGGTGWPGVTNFSRSVFAADKGDHGTLLLYGASGHSAVNATCWAGLDVGPKTWSIVGEKPLPCTAVSYVQDVAPDPAFFNHTWGHWLGDAAWAEGFSNPGYNPCLGGHTKQQICYRPAAKAGNASGELYTTYKQTSSADSGTGLTGCHVIDLDTMLPIPMGAAKANSGDNLGPTLYYETEDILIGMFAESTSAGSGTFFDIYDCAAKTWTHKTGFTNPPRYGGNFQLQSTGFICGGLYVLVHPTWLVDTAPGFDLWAIEIADVIAGSGAWTQLTVSGTGYPYKANGLCTMQEWAECPDDGAFYTVDGKLGSQTLYKLTPPGGGDAANLAGTWALSSDELTGDALSASEYLYGRMHWCPAITAFLHQADINGTNGGQTATLAAPVLAIRPIGV